MGARRLLWILIAVNILLAVVQLLWAWILGRNIALLLACASGDVRRFRLALLMGADPNAHTSNGTTALMLAAQTGLWFHVKDLIDKGADVNRRNEDGETALFMAVRVGDVTTVDILLRHGADPNVRATRFEVTPLMMAAGYGRLRIVELLLSHGADPTLRDRRGFTVWNFVNAQNGGERAKITALIKQKLSETRKR